MEAIKIYSLLHVCAQSLHDKNTDGVCVSEVLEYVADEVWKLHEKEEEENERAEDGQACLVH